MCVWLYIDRYYTIPKSTLVYEKGSWSLGWQSWIFFYFEFTIFCKVNPCLWGKPTNFVAVLAQNTCVYGCRLELYHLNFNISLISRSMKPGLIIIDGFLFQSHHFLSNQSKCWRKIDSFCGCSGPKTHVCVVVDQCYTIPKSILLY